MAWVRFMQCEANRWAARGLDILFPPQCPICRMETAERACTAADQGLFGPGLAAAAVCEACTRELSADIVRCIGCGAPVSGMADCRNCSRQSRVWGRVAVLSAYAGGLREAVLRAKRPAGANAAAALAGLLIGKHGDAMRRWGSDAVVPVPMHWLRRALRGGSVADDIAAVVANLLGVPCSRVLSRSRATRMQNELPIEDRPRNVQGAFFASRRLAGRRILLVDDVMTTGATLAACARALLAAGASGVDAAVVARADSLGSRHDE